MNDESKWCDTNNSKIGYVECEKCGICGHKFINNLRHIADFENYTDEISPDFIDKNNIEVSKSGTTWMCCLGVVLQEDEKCICGRDCYEK